MSKAKGVSEFFGEAIRLLGKVAAFEDKQSEYDCWWLVLRMFALDPKWKPEDLKTWDRLDPEEGEIDEDVCYFLKDPTSKDADPLANVGRRFDRLGRKISGKPWSWSLFDGRYYGTEKTPEDAALRAVEKLRSLLEGRIPKCITQSAEERAA